MFMATEDPGLVAVVVPDGSDGKVGRVQAVVVGIFFTCFRDPAWGPADSNRVGGIEVLSEGSLHMMPHQGRPDGRLVQLLATGGNEASRKDRENSF